MAVPDLGWWRATNEPGGTVLCEVWPSTQPRLDPGSMPVSTGYDSVLWSFPTPFRSEDRVVGHLAYRLGW